MATETTTITADIIRETAAAVFVTDSVTEVWLPKSQIEYDGIPGDKAVEIDLPIWLAEEKGMI